jgi:phosphatidylinositol-4,5-bisphosphate 4-phosphatase
MDIRLETFRVNGSSRLVLTGPGLVGKAELSLADRFKGVVSRTGGSFRHGSAMQQDQNREFKTAFKEALIKAEGHHAAYAAVLYAGLPSDWVTSPKALGSRKINAILDQSKTYRIRVSQANDRAIAEFLTTLGSLFVDSNNQPAGDAGSREFRKVFTRDVKLDPRYAQRKFDTLDLKEIAKESLNSFRYQKAKQFEEAHPGLAIFTLRGHVTPPRRETQSVIDELEVSLRTPTSKLGGERGEFRTLALVALKKIRQNSELLSKMAFDPAGWQTLDGKLRSRHVVLTQLENQFRNATTSIEAGRDFQADMIDELRHQLALLEAKLAFVKDTSEMDPFSAKAVAYSNLLWAHAAGHLFDGASRYVKEHRSPEQSAKLTATLAAQKALHLAARTQEYAAASSTVRMDVPSRKSRKTHPAVRARQISQAFVKQALERAGLPASEIRRLTDAAGMKDARRRALNSNPDWAPFSRDMVVTKAGVTRQYRSAITPGAHISPRFSRRYASSVPLEGPSGPPHPARAGVSSAEKADHYHARNLKVSELHRVIAGTDKVVSTVIGHGVLDSWDIPDPAERAAANARAAQEVLEAALVTNDRIRTIALNRRASNDTTPVSMSHVSVNLTTPAGWRELPGFAKTALFHDYQEQTYTRAQFEAFKANFSIVTGRQHVTLKIDDTRPNGDLGQDVEIAVRLDVFSFSFGINPLATGKVPAFVGGWQSVDQHNRNEMRRYIGDSEMYRHPSRFSMISGVQGRRPGGFVGSVMDLLNPALADQAALASRIQQQTDIVRGLFLSEAFRRGNGDPAKMGREVLALQVMVEQALGLTGADHADHRGDGRRHHSRHRARTR